MRFLYTVVSAALVVMAFGCRRPPPPPNVVLIVLDTVRASQCSAWGYTRPTTPGLEALLESGTKYAQAYSASSWTLPSHASLFTGRYPFEHGAHGVKYTDAKGAEQILDAPLPLEAVTLAEDLGAAGYYTAAYCANTVYLTPRYQLDQGFDRYFNENLTADKLVARALTEMKPRADQPFFLFLNLIDAHWPFNTEEIPGLIEGPVPQGTDASDVFRKLILTRARDDAPELAAEVTKQYDTGIAHTDLGVQKVCAWLREQGLYEDALVIVTSDHGEFIGEHQLTDHSKDVYNEVIHVPLAVKYPGQRDAKVVEEPVSLNQVYTTIMEHARIEARGKAPALDAMLDDFPILAELYYSRNWDFTHPEWGHRFQRIRSVLVEGDWKLIHSSDEAHELYNLQSDPRELDNRFPAEKTIFSKMLDRLRGIKPLEDAGPAAEVTAPGLTPEEIEAMRSLGYLE